ncbi:glycerol-3-phosphate dehydrogenase subunit GlpB [Halobacteriales archaeon QS_5_70_15]|nr:MAG: glycerol-3-phosphate dehydrogenase subunit GlpB [Halobacteriales archaeon QS_5_70_15]
MAIESEVLVVGGGLAGLSSAISAAREGANVRLVSYKQSTLRNASGLVDVLGYTHEGEGPLTDPYDAIPELPTEHPYRTVGANTVREAMAAFDQSAPNYRGGHTDLNALLPTHGGTIKPTARYPAGASAGLASDARNVLLVGFESMVDFDAEHAAAHLRSAGVPFEVRGVTIRFPGDLRADAKITRYAKLLDTNAGVPVRGRDRPVREALAERVNTEREGEPRVGFPAVLGDEDTAGVRVALEERLGTDVFEVPMGPPSLPGLRLEDALFEALDEAGASIETGNPVVDYEVDGEGRVERVYVERNGARIPNSADQYVLATGGLVGKGVESDRGRVYEPVFRGRDRPVREALAERVNTEREGEPRVGFPAVLGGYDFAAEKSGSGVSIATGYAAGRRAAQETR